MSKKMAKAVSQMNEMNKLRSDEIVTNFMGGDSYKVNPLDTLKLISASSIFGEASYYRKDVKDGKFSWQKEFTDPAMYAIFSASAGKSTTEVFTEAIDKALDYDFDGTLDFAVDSAGTDSFALSSVFFSATFFLFAEPFFSTASFLSSISFLKKRFLSKTLISSMVNSVSGRT